MKRVVAIIQARCGSTRLPGKVMSKLAGKPVVWHIIERVKRVKNIDDIVVATTVSRKDDRLIDYLKRIGVRYFRGSEKNVLDRFIKAAKRFDADIVVRICADSPLIEPTEIKKMITRLLKENADYVLVRPRVKCIHEGFEVVNVDALKKQLSFSGANYVKEHVTIYIRERPERFKIAYYTPMKDFQREGPKLSVDTPADLRFMRKVYRRLYRPGEIVDLKQVIRLIDKDAWLRRHNLWQYNSKCPQA